MKEGMLTTLSDNVIMSSVSCFMTVAGHVASKFGVADTSDLLSCHVLNVSWLMTVAGHMASKYK